VAQEGAVAARRDANKHATYQRHGNPCYTFVLLFIETQIRDVAATSGEGGFTRALLIGAAEGTTKRTVVETAVCEQSRLSMVVAGSTELGVA
jgi:hypothetical protein